MSVVMVKACMFITESVLLMDKYIGVPLIYFVKYSLAIDEGQTPDIMMSQIVCYMNMAVTLALCLYWG
eukprot:5137722-Amphidinium_carterae.1